MKREFIYEILKFYAESKNTQQLETFTIVA